MNRGGSGLPGMLDKFTTPILLLACVFIVSGCVAGDNSYTPNDLANFWSGIWHGMISVITLIWGLFDPSVEVYERMNNGSWYDFGFLLGSGALAGGGSSAATK